MTWDFGVQSCKNSGTKFDLKAEYLALTFFLCKSYNWLQDIGSLVYQESTHYAMNNLKVHSKQWKCDEIFVIGFPISCHNYNFGAVSVKIV